MEAQQKFDKSKWIMNNGNDYPYRDDMLNDLINNVKLKEIKYDSLISLLGPANREDGQYLFYRIMQHRLGFFVLSEKTLVVKLNEDSTVAWRKIKE